MSEPITAIVPIKLSNFTFASSSLQTIATIPNPGYTHLLYEFEVTVNALTDFDVLGRGQAPSNYSDYTIDWTLDPTTGRFIEHDSTEASDNLAATPANGNGMFLMEVGNLGEIIVKANAPVNTVIAHRYTLHNGV